MSKKPITIQMDPALIASIDRRRGRTARQVWIAEACEQRLVATPKLRLPPRVRSSAEARADVQPVPKAQS